MLSLIPITLIRSKKHELHVYHRSRLSWHVFAESAPVLYDDDERNQVRRELNAQQISDFYRRIYIDATADEEISFHLDEAVDSNDKSSVVWISAE